MRAIKILLPIAALLAGHLEGQGGQGGQMQPITAPRPYRRHFWLETGGGTGTTRIACSTCPDLTIMYGESSYLRMGGSLSDRILLGVETFTLLDKRVLHPNSGDTSAVIENESIAPIVMWYPWKGGVFVKGGVGLAHGAFTVRRSSVDSVVTEGWGSGLTFGAGFDMPIRKWLSITANIGIYYTALGDVTVQGTSFEDLIATMYNANFAITIR